MKKQMLLVIIALTGFVAASHAEKIDLEVYASKFDSIPIGIVDFKSTNGQQLHENAPWIVIGNDFDFCGRFQVFRRSEYDSAAFYDASVGIYIDGEYTIEGEEISINCYLRDVTNRELIIGKKYKGNMKAMRHMAHRYCNEIVEMLFGDRGIFESRVLFVRNEGTKKSVGIMDFDGFNASKLTKNNFINIFPAFEDSLRFLWVSYMRGKPDIYRGSTIDGSNKIFIHSRFVQSSPDVSIIDGTVAYASSKAGNMDVYTCDPDGGNVKQLTTGRTVDTSPCWSPNGTQIAFTSDRTGNPAIYVMDASGGNQHKISFAGRYQDSPAWSPKGDLIAYADMADNSKFDVWVIAPDGSNAKKVTGMAGNNEYPTWSPDGSLIGFVNSYGNKSDMYVVKPDGTKLRRVTTTGDVKMPAWSRF